MKSYLYIASYYDKLGREVNINDKKIGITTNPNSRENSLNYTKGPIGTTFIKLYEFAGQDTARNIEKNIFHNLLSDRNTDGEWFSDDDLQIIDMVETTINSLSSFIQIKEVELDSKLSYVEKETIRKSNSKMIVTFNGEVLDAKSAKELYLKTFEMIGYENISKVENETIITNDESKSDYRFVKKGEWFINTNFSNESKKSILERIKTNLNLDLQVEIKS